MIGAHIDVILIVTGALTAVAILQFIAPAPIVRAIYGEAPKDATSLALARQWGLLIFLIGALLVYAAFYPAVRGPAVLLAAIEKIALGVGVLGTTLRNHPIEPRSLAETQSSRSSTSFIWGLLALMHASKGSKQWM